MWVKLKQAGLPDEDIDYLNQGWGMHIPDLPGEGETVTDRNDRNALRVTRNVTGDVTAAERMRRYRARKKAKIQEQTVTPASRDAENTTYNTYLLNNHIAETETVTPSVTPPERNEAKPKKVPRYSEPFETFWKAYPRKPQGSKGGAWLEWQKLTAADRDTATRALPAFARAMREEGRESRHIKHAEQFLKKRDFDTYADLLEAEVVEQRRRQEAVRRYEEQRRIEIQREIDANPAKIREQLLQGGIESFPEDFRPFVLAQFGN
jgi:hypothetical protein